MKHGSTVEQQENVQQQIKLKLPPSSYVKAQKVIEYICRISKSQKQNELLPSAATLNYIVNDINNYNVESVDWDEIINLLESMLKGQYCDPVVHYHALLLQEELLAHKVREAKFRLELEEKRAELLHALDHVLYKAGCLASCLRTGTDLSTLSQTSKSGSTTQELIEQLRNLT